MTLSIGSCFSGIGGLELGLEMAIPGAVVAWQCDSDPCARAVLAEHWPGVRIYEDVRHIDATARPVDLICGGAPCQPVSLAGQRKAQGDTRWLWPHFAAAIARVRPRYVFIENVPGLRTAGLREVLADLAALGFDAEWDCFSAAETGAPHRRQRLFVLAYADRIAQFEPGSLAPAPVGDGRQGARAAAGGGGEYVAHADGEGELQQGGFERSQRRRPGRRRAEALADTDRERFVGRPDDEAPAGEAGGDAAQGDHTWSAESDVGGSVAGVSARLGGLRGWGPDWEEGIPRVQHGVKGRVDRLRLLGNSCVPAQAALAWRTLSARCAA